VPVCPPPVPATVTVEEPVGAEDEVLIVRVLEKVGFPEIGLKLQEAPEGRPLAQDKPTDCVEPLVKVTVMITEPDEPRVTVIAPELDSEKSKFAVNVPLPMSPVEAPVTVTVYVPLAAEATVKDPDIAPLDIAHVGSERSPLGDEDIVQLVSPGSKFDPETKTLAPAGPEFGDSVIVGEMKFAVSVMGSFITMVTGLLIPE
jgi:hypothetical protein